MSDLFRPPAGRWVYSPSGPGEVTAFEVRQVLAEGRSRYQHYLVVDTAAFGRVLLLDGQIQSCEYDEWQYHEALVQPAMCAHPAPRRVAVLGGGEGAVLREVLRHPTVESAVMVDIDHEVVLACEEHLEPFHRGAFGDPRVTLVADDARDWLDRSGPARFDVVVVDLTEPLAGGPSCRLFTREFYAIVRASLAEAGLLALQAGPLRPGMSWAFGRVVRTLERVFAAVLPYSCWVTSYFEQWGFALAGAPEAVSSLSPGLLDERLRERGIEPRFLDGETFEGLVRLSRSIRDEIGRQTEPITDAEPLGLRR